MKDINKSLIMKEHGKCYDIRNLDGSYTRYPMGQVLLEFTLLDLQDVSSSIASHSDLFNIATVESLKEALNKINKTFSAKYLFAQAKILHMFLSNFIDDHLHNKLHDIDKQAFENYYSVQNSSIQHKDTIYYVFQLAIGALSNYQNEAIDIVKRIFSDNASTIEYTNRFPSLYKTPAIETRYLLEPDHETGEMLFSEFLCINSIEALFSLEIKNIIKNNVELQYCNSCGRPFVPMRKNKALYCQYPSLEYPTIACCLVAAKTETLKNQKNDEVRTLYRKLYTRYRQAALYHEGDLSYLEKVYKLSQDYKEWKSKLSKGLATEDDILGWLRSMDANQSDDSAIMDIF